MTILAFKQRMSAYPDEALCCGTFWLAADFLTLDISLDDDGIEAAMELAEDRHDAAVGFNWQHLQASIELVKRG